MGRKGAGAKKDVDVLLKFLLFYHPLEWTIMNRITPTTRLNGRRWRGMVWGANKENNKSPDLGGRKRLPTAPSLFSGRRNDFDIVYYPATPETNQPLSRAPSSPPPSR